MGNLTYALFGIDTVLRIVGALAFFFVLIPRLALPPRPDAGVLERFWWNFAFGIVFLVLAGQLLSLGNLYTLPSLLFVLLLLVVAAHCIRNRESPVKLIRRNLDLVVIAAFNILDRRVNLPRRARLTLRRMKNKVRDKTTGREAVLRVTGWTALTLITAALRLYRPFSSLDFGASDPYIHLYWLKMLELGKQVDFEWGPYPRGLHFLLLAIVKLTNVDEVLLMNFFGGIVGILITLSVADVARRISGSLRTGLVAGLLFATMIGGPKQSWLIGGSAQPSLLRGLSQRTFHYGGQEMLFVTGETEGLDDVMFGGFVRQTVTLPQEMAIVLLFPSALFLLDYLRDKSRWSLYGYSGGVAAISAIHPGVLLPFSMLLIGVFVAASTSWKQRPGEFKRLAIATSGSIALGFSWAYVFLFYRREGGWLSYSLGDKSLAYFAPVIPKLIKFNHTSDVPLEARVRFYSVTTLAMVLLAVASLLLFIVTFFQRDKKHSASLKFLAVVTLLMLFVQVSTSFGMPALLDAGRNAQWLMISVACMIAVTLNELFLRFFGSGRLRRLTSSTLLVAGLTFWITRVPDIHAQSMRTKDFVDATEYGGAVEALLHVRQTLKPLTWTFVSYGQEFPHVLGRGFYLPAAEFLEHYDPTSPVVTIPTQYVFIAVEKTSHPFEILTWAATFSRANLEERLRAWCVIYQTKHDDMRVYQDGEKIRIYVIQRTPQETDRIAKLGAPP